MILTASDVAFLSKALSCWELAEYTFAALVAVACAGEYAAEFTDWFTGGIKEAKDRLAKRSTLLLIVALAFELLCLVKTNSLSGQLIGSLSDKAENADKKAQSAIDKSGIAETKSGNAITKTDEALGKVGAAKHAAKLAREQADDAAKVGQAVAQYAAVVAHLVNARHLDRAKFMELMKGQRKATAIIQYELFDSEAEVFANELNSALGKNGLGWDSTVEPFPSLIRAGGVLSPEFALQYVADSTGLAYAVKTEESKDFNNLRIALGGSIEMSLGGWGKGAAMSILNPSLPDKTFVIGIGRHIPNVPLFTPPKVKTQRSNPKPKS